ncbi:MAG: DUF5690 family protein [Planctomycetota bacterium]
MQASRFKTTNSLFIAGAAAFCTYFCMYAFRKPFSAATYEGQMLWGHGLKDILVVSQIGGYMLSKLVGVKVVSEMTRGRAALVLVGLILFAELALVGFAFVPIAVKPFMLALNGLPLGMVFGLVLLFLEGRKQTEALSAALCASFIISSGAVKSIGATLIEDWHVSEFQMPMLTGLMFLLPLVASVWVLTWTPPPSEEDREARTDRGPMSSEQRWQFFRSYWPGLSLMILVYIALTVVRTVRDDFGVEIWRDMGVAKEPKVFVNCETVVAFIVVTFNAAAIWIRHHLKAIRIISISICLAFGLSILAAWLRSVEAISPFVFMVACGVGLYIPYVAFHTTLFERLVAASSRPGNLVFLMYLADSTGYLGYTGIVVAKSFWWTPTEVLSLFLYLLVAIAGFSIIAMLAALFYFERRLRGDPERQEEQVT